MNIQPQSHISIMKGIEWDSSYKNIRLFNNIGEQNTYMASHVVKTVTGATYVRKNGAIAVPGSADEYYNCDYLAFHNVGFTNKIFYGFIKEVEYVNTSTTYLYIEVDLIQSWLFEMDIEKCFVEREHVSDDTIGKHTVPENIPFGELVNGTIRTIPQTPCVTLQYATDDISGDMSNYMFNPLSFVRSTSDFGTINRVLTDLSDTPERVADLSMGYYEIGDQDITITRLENSAFAHAGESYTPVNNKLYTYPYCCIAVDDYGSNTSVFAWEDFLSPTEAKFRIKNSYGPPNTSSFIPLNYKDMGEASKYMVVKMDFPSCPFIIDNYRAWLSNVGAKQAISEIDMVYQNTLTDYASFAGALSSGVGSLQSGNLAGAVAGAVGSGVQFEIGRRQRESSIDTRKQLNSVDKSVARTHGVSIGGQFGGGSAEWFNGNIGWRISQMTIKPEYARIIDEFFSRFGYKVNRYKVPALKTRNRFNYVKTVEAVVVGNAPDEAITLYENILNAGVTFWHVNNIGTFSIINEVSKIGEE